MMALCSANPSSIVSGDYIPAYCHIALDLLGQRDSTPGTSSSIRDQIVGVVKLGINGLFSCKCYKREMNLWCALLWVMLQDQFSNIDFRNREWPRGFMEQKTH